jgi:hypothetical protein
MKIKALVQDVDIRQSDGKEYVTVTCSEIGEDKLLQMFDYNLRQEEAPLKATLAGKEVEIVVKTIRAIFSGRPQLVGRLTLLASGKAPLAGK